MVRKAVIEQDKQCHRQEGHCFKCFRRGHLIRDCPIKKLRAKTAFSSQNGEPPRYDNLAKGDNLANLALKLMDEEQDTFIKKVMAYEPEEDFLPA